MKQVLTLGTSLRMLLGAGSDTVTTVTCSLPLAAAGSAIASNFTAALWSQPPVSVLRTHLALRLLRKRTVSKIKGRLSIHAVCECYH